MAGSIYTGYRLAGTPGLLIGYALSGLLQYPFLAKFVRNHGVWIPKLDLLAVITVMLSLTAATWLRPYLHQLLQ